MTPENASRVKRGGHLNEDHYAELIGGEVDKVDVTGKKDVIDKQHRTHSVKGGEKKWQIFLYGRNRLITNTILQGIGDVADHLVSCLDSLPKTRSERESDKQYYKDMLKQPMRDLRDAIDKPKILPAFFHKAFFNAGEVNYLAILPTDIDVFADIKEKIYHIFDGKEAIDVICGNIEITNSKKRGRGQTDDQKVVFRTNRNIGEIEIRTDPSNYGKAKMWMDANLTFNLLKEHIPFSNAADRLGNQLLLYGKAKRFKL